MPLSDRNIVITPNRGATSEPNIRFTGADASSSATITLRVYNTGTVGSLSFEGNSGQLFSMSDTFTGTIFSVNDVSGIPSIEVLDTGEIRMAQFSGYVNILNSANATSTNTGALRVVGGVGIARDLWVGGLIEAASTTNATNTITGALQVVGGVGIGRDVYIGGLLNVAGGITANITGVSSQVQTQAQTANASYFPTFVDSNNPSTTGENLFTTSSFVINPSTGNVGIGTASPGARLQVAGGAIMPANGNSTTAGIQFPSDPGGGSGDAAWIRYYVRSGEATNLEIGISNDSDDHIYLNPGSGNVGIGLNNPSAKLEVSGTTRITGITTIANTTQATSTTTGALVVSGGVGIGGNLHVGGDVVANRLIIQLTTITTTLVQTDDVIQTLNTSNATSTTTGALQVAGGAGIQRDVWIGGSLNVAGGITGASSQVQTTAQTGNANYLPTFVDSNNPSATAESLFTTSSFIINPATGSVAIGANTSATYKLNVAQTIQVGGQGGTDVTQIGGGSGIGSYIRGYYGIDGTQAFNISGNGNSYVQASTAGGSFGIGTNNPQARLHVNGGDTWIGNEANTVQNLVFRRNAAAVGSIGTYNSQLEFSGGNTQGAGHLVITSTGNIGIGITSPTSRLHVVGTATVVNTTTSALNIRSNAAFISPNSANTITVRMLDSDVITFNGAAGQLFSISDSFTGTIFAVNDVSGVPSIEVYDTGLVSLAEFTGNVGVGTTSTAAKLDVNGTFRVSSTATINTNTNATNTVTGALQVVGGVGIGRDVYIGGSLNVSGGITANITGVSSQVQTQAQTGNANYFPVFVDSNNPSSTGELLYTTSSLTVNPSTGEVDILGTSNATSTTTGALVVTGGVGVGRDVRVAGRLYATTKSFLIDHPSKPGMKLQYGSLESPYHGIRLTGEDKLVKGICIVKLPDYIKNLAKSTGAQVQITNIKHNKLIWVEDIDIENNTFTVKAKVGFFDKREHRFYWSFTAIRKDIEDLDVEIY